MPLSISSIRLSRGRLARWLCRPTVWAACTLTLLHSLPVHATEATLVPGATVESLLALARDRHPELRAMQFEADAAALRVGPAGALPDPMLQAELRDATNEMTGGKLNLLPGRVGSTRYQLRQGFLPWGQRAARRDAAQAGADEAAWRARVTGADLAARIKSAHVRWQQLHLTLAQTQALQALAGRLEAAALARYTSGLAPQQDVIRTQIERTAITTELAQLQSERRATQARINGLVARPADAPLAAPDVEASQTLPMLPDGKVLLQRVLERNPQLAADAARLRAAERGKDAVWANRYPALTVGVAPVQTRKRISEWELMLELNIPLQQSSRRAEEGEALAMVAAAQARREANRHEILAQLGELLAGLEAARQVGALTRGTLLPQAELGLQAALAAYETGKVDLSTVLDAQGQVRRAQLSLIRTHADAHLRQAEIERLLGETL